MTDVALGFAAMDLPISPPFPPMEARSADRLPAGDGWVYEPKWDGFRCLSATLRQCTMDQVS